MVTTSGEKKVNKSAFVRNVLKEIGALSVNPPEGWRQKVEDALVAQNLKMAKETIYTIRYNAMKNKKKRAKTVEAEGNGRRKKNKIENVSIADIKALQKFAERFGGLDNLESVILLLKSLNQ